jgi:hypothetical protein
MKNPLFLISALTTALAGSVCALEQDNAIIADEKNAELYDTPYSLNPVPIQPNTPQPASWKNAYQELHEQQMTMQSKLDALTKEVEMLKQTLSSTTAKS